MKYLIFTLLIVITTSCAIFNAAPKPRSTVVANNIEKKIHLGMTFNELIGVLGVKPEKLAQGTYSFLLKDGKLMTRFTGEDDNPRELVLWKAFIDLPNEDMLLEADSKKQSMELMKNNPICISVEISFSSNSPKTATGYCYYEQFSPDNIYIKAVGDDAQIQMYFINGRFVFVNGVVKDSDVLKYLTGYIANLNLLQSILGEGIAKAALCEKTDDNKRLFSIKNETEPLMIVSLNKKLVYPAPWQINGFLIPIKNKKGYNFDFTMSVKWKQLHSATVIQKTEFKGYFIQKKKQIADNIDFSSWRQFALNSTENDLSITPLPLKVKTMNELPDQN